MAFKIVPTVNTDAIYTPKALNINTYMFFINLSHFSKRMQTFFKL